MSYLDKSQIVELARKTREIDERPSAVLEPFYLRAFEKYAAKFPNDLNFIVELAQPGKPSVGGNGFGVATCLEDYCWVDVRLGAEPTEPDGGRKHGFGALWEYQVHCEGADHKKGRDERCAKTIRYLPTDGGGNNAAPVAPAPAPAPVPVPAAAFNGAPGPSRAAPVINKPAATAGADRKSAFPPQPSSSPFSQPRAGSSSSNVLKPSTKQNLPMSSPAGRLGDVKPSIPKSRSVMSMLDDDEVSVVRPEDVPMEFRKVTNEANPYTLDDDDEEPAGPSSSASRPAAPQLNGQGPLQVKPEPIAGPSRITIPGQPAAPLNLYVTAQNLPTLQATLEGMKQDRDVYVQNVYRALLAPNPGLVRPAELYNHANVLAGLRYNPDTAVYPPLPISIVTALPTVVPLDNLAREKHELFRKAALELDAQIKGAQAAGLLPVPGSIHAAAVPAAAAANALVPSVGLGVVPAVGALPNPHGLEGEELDDYHDQVYGRNLGAGGDLQTFFQDALKDFSEDQDVDKALKVLGLANMGQMFGDMTVALMAHQILGVAFMLTKERDVKFQGGLLCDAMGLGKTVQTIATLVGNQSEDGRVKTTLIVAPLAVLSQWKAEIESKTAEGTFNILVHHGQTRAKTTAELKRADIVLTTYGTLVSDFAEPKEKKKKKKRNHIVSGLLPSDEEEDDAPARPAKKKGPTFRMRWFRVVLDEAHFIRNRATQASKAVADLDAVHRWSLTGTLINNSLDDVFPHLRFLGISPQQDWAEFSKHIGGKAKKNPTTAAKRTQAILKTCMMRRHKDSILNGQRLLNLPEKTTTMVQLDFSDEERAIYDQVENRMKIRFGKFLKQGTVLNHLSCVLTMLMRLRQLTCHPWLLRRNPGDPAHPDDFEVSDEDLNLSMNIPIVNAGADFINAAAILGEDWVNDVTARLKKRHQDMVDGPEVDDEDKETECSICLEMFDTETVVECKHSFCRSCIDDVFATAPRDGGDLTDEQAARGARKCPLCRGMIEKNKMFAAIAFFDPEKEEGGDEKNGEGSGSGEGADRKGKRKSTAGDDSDDDSDDDSRSAKRADKGKGKAKADEEDEEMDEIRNVLPSTKMKVLGDLIDEYLAEDGIKVIIFSEFVTYLKLVERFLDNKGIHNRIYHGGMRTSDREDVVKEFTGPIKHDRSPRVMLISRKAGGAGLNLTAASKVISLDLAWNAASENQAVDRAHRIGQTRPVDVQRLIINNTVEQRILELQEKKSALADGAMGEGTGGRLGRLTVQDLMRLFNYEDE